MGVYDDKTGKPTNCSCICPEGFAGLWCELSKNCKAGA